MSNRVGMGMENRTIVGLALLCAAALTVGCGDDAAGGDTDASPSVQSDPPPTGTDAGPTEPTGECVPEEPLVAPELLPECELCGNARCVPAAFVPEEQRELLADCSDGSKCVPDLLIETNGKFTLTTCRSIGDAEGRCVSTCLPSASAQADRLPTAGCQAEEVCVPCFDPTTGEDTGACGLGCDPGATEPPATFAACCGDLGSCVPTAAVPEDQRALLGPDTCTGDALCAPSDMVDATFIPPTCDSVAGVEGRCLPACLPDVAAQADTLPIDSCAATHLCVPCFDPTTGEATGACGLNGDAPAGPPVTFDRCCGGIGACVPSDVIPADQRDLLGADTCTEMDQLCAPDALIAGDVPPSCRSVAGGEGRCLPECLPSVAAQASLLPRDSCAEAHLCVPCFDPTTGEETGSCRLSGDMPSEPAVTFERCCGGVGLCVPPSTVPAAQRDQLGTDTCMDATALCAPEEFTDSAFTPPTCRSIADVEGRCLPACLPDVAALGSSLPRSTCAATHLCAPCYDPTDGSATGSCALNGDMPLEPPFVFPGCCTFAGMDRGSCVPSSSVPAGDRDSLPADTCATDNLCVPGPLLADPTYVFPACTTGGFLGGDPGACVPDCMTSFFEGLFLTPSGCSAGDLCAPCVNPLTGSTSGACR